MSITILQRMEDGSIKNHNEAANAEEDDDAGTGMADVSTDLVAGAGDGGL